MVVGSVLSIAETPTCSRPSRRSKPRLRSASLVNPSRNARIMPKSAISLSTRPNSCTRHNNLLRVQHSNFSLHSLQLAAVVYEHENDSIRAAVGLAAADTPTQLAPQTAASSINLASLPIPLPGLEKVTENFVPPGELVSRIFNRNTSAAVDKALTSYGDERIREFAAAYGIEFEVVSELNTVSSAFCGLFWDPKSNWIVVAFKGTGPIEYGEWMTYVLFLPYASVKINPSDVSVISPPPSSISGAICLVSAEHIWVSRSVSSLMMSVAWVARLLMPTSPSPSRPSPSISGKLSPRELVYVSLEALPGHMRLISST